MGSDELEDDDDDRTVTGITVPQVALEQPTPYLVVVVSPDATGQLFRLDRDNMVIGRASDADVRIEEASISRYHLRVHLRGERVEIVDLGSKNGTFFEGERVERAELADGAKFQLGSSTVLKVSYQDSLDEKLQQNLYDSATRDALTGLYNRKYFYDALDKEFTFALRSGMPVSVVMMDLDHFKSVNDTFGHPIGDQVLIRVADVLSGSVRNEDVLARLGGEEFGVILRDCPSHAAVRFAERVRRSIERLPLELSGHSLQVTMSAGVAALQSDTSVPSCQALVELADQSLYRAKQMGRNRVCVSESPEAGPA